MDDEGDELEPEVLSYRELRKRETSFAWQERRRAHEWREYLTRLRAGAQGVLTTYPQSKNKASSRAPTKPV